MKSFNSIEFIVSFIYVIFKQKDNFIYFVNIFKEGYQLHQICFIKSLIKPREFKIVKIPSAYVGFNLFI